MISHTKTMCCWSAMLLGFFFLLSPDLAHAARQYAGLCAIVKIEIHQRLALERVGFLATLRITNNEVDANITDFSASLTFKREPSDPDGEYEEASDAFFVQPPELQGIDGVDGSGIIGPGETAIISWFIIPKIAAGGATPDGTDYEVGAEIAGKLYGEEIPHEMMLVLPATITVLPEAQLEITYFQPRDVDADNPFTPQVEAPIPFTLGVLVKNVGYGIARDVVIKSEQPRIVDNEQGLILVAQLLGARIDDEPTDYTSLTLNIGDVESGGCRKGAWDMITTLSGEFQEFKASYTHASELGGRETSIIKDINAYFIVHEVLNDQPGRDNLLDFLADTVDDEEFVPDTLYESDCNVLPVNQLTDVQLTDYSNYTARVSASADFENWVYLRLKDPAQGRYVVSEVTRSDGKVLNENNYWVNIKYDPKTNARLTYLNIFDFVALGDYEYVVTYQSRGQDTDPPVTTIRFSGESYEQGGIYYILPDTRIFFTAEDENLVSIYRKLDDEPDFVAALPFAIEIPGTHTVEYYSRDSFNNEEAHKTATVVVSGEPPSIQNIVCSTDELFNAGDSISVRPTNASVSLEVTSTAAKLQGEAGVYRGVYGYVTLSGIPSSPTTQSDATITAGGENVDFYRYRVNHGTWSDEYPVATAITLSGLSGDVYLDVKGRSRYGDYLEDSEALAVSWRVDSGAAPIFISGPETPNRSTDAALNVSGTDRYCYRIDHDYYMPESEVGAPITLSSMDEGEHVVEVVTRSDGASCPADVDGTVYRWAIDRNHGFNLPGTARVYHTSLGEVSETVKFDWDGMDDTGAVVPPGWYTIIISITDSLGRITKAGRLVHVGDMLPDGELFSDSGNAAQDNVQAFGKWAVWQDQRNGNWDIYAQDLRDELATPVAVTSSSLNQESPRTDGRYVVWEDRQADGTWDIWAEKLDAGAPFAITQTPAMNERKPVVYWPWVVYQAKPVSNPSAPWQLFAYNMNTHTSDPLDTTTQDQVDAAIYKQNVVWQDFRDTGPGEIYYKNLKTGEVRRITDQPAAQLWPAIYGHWIVWSDNRNTQLDLYGFNLKRNAEVQLTNTPYDETRPAINDKWVVFTEDSAGELKTNIRILHLSNLSAVQLTNVESEKEKPSMASGKLVWTDKRNGFKQAMVATMPNLQPVFNNRNSVAVTESMSDLLHDAFTLLTLWNKNAGVVEITHYSSILPQPVQETATWDGNHAAGSNFSLQPGSFIWVQFNASEILDLGNRQCNAIDLQTGVNVFSYTCFPDHYSAYKLIRELGISNINAIRLLNSETGRWQVAAVAEGKITGEDFDIPPVSVIMLDMHSPILSWKPGEAQ